MKWKVKIEGKETQKIIVSFDPLNEQIIFTGQYRPYGEWINFCEEKHSMNIDLDNIQIMLGKICDKLNARIEAYENIAEGFKYIKEIAIKDE